MSATLSVALGVSRRTLYVFFSHPSFFLPVIIFPLFFFTAFAGGLSQVSNVPNFDFAGDYTSFQFVFVLLQSAAFGGVFTGFGIARDFENGFSRRLLLAAPNRRGIVLGYAFAAFVRWSVTAVVLFTVGLVVGMDIGGNGVDMFALIVLAVLVNAAAVLWAAGVAMRLRTMQAGPVMQLPVFLLLFLAPVYVPLELLAGWLEVVATLNPMTVLLESGRSLISDEPKGVMLAFAVAAALMAGFGIWALRGLRSAEAAGG